MNDVFIFITSFFWEYFYTFSVPFFGDNDFVMPTKLNHHEDFDVCRVRVLVMARLSQ